MMSITGCFTIFFQKLGIFRISWEKNCFLFESDGFFRDPGYFEIDQSVTTIYPIHYLMCVLLLMAEIPAPPGMCETLQIMG